MAKVEFVKLTKSDLEKVIDLLQAIVDYKAKSLTAANWARFESEYLPKAIDAIRHNNFKVVDPSNSIISWLIDQAVHSRRILDGVPKKDWILLVDIESVQETLAMLRAASRGQMSYNIYASNNTTYQDLFQ
jgi:hypothetical protein